MVRAQKDLRLRLSFLFGWWVFSQNLSILILNQKCNPETKVLVRSIQPYLSKKCNTVHITQILYGLYIIKCTPQEIEVEFIWLLKKSNFTRLLIWTQSSRKLLVTKITGQSLEPIAVNIGTEKTQNIYNFLSSFFCKYPPHLGAENIKCKYLRFFWVLDKMVENLQNPPLIEHSVSRDLETFRGI